MNMTTTVCGWMRIGRWQDLPYTRERKIITGYTGWRTADGREKKTADQASVCEFSRLRLKQEFTDEGDFSVNSGLLKKTENLRARYPEDIAVRL